VIRSDHVPVARSRYLSLDDSRLHYLEAGEDLTSAGRDGESAAPPVVLLHGSGIDDAALSWKHAIEFLLDRGRRVYALDWPGYGESEDPPGAMTTEYYRGVLRDFLDAAGIDRAALVGISMGGSAALGIALDDPDRVERLVLVDSYGLRDAVPGGIGSYLLANTPFANVFGRQFASSSLEATRMAVGEFVHDPAGLSDEFVAEVNERLRRPGAGESFFGFMRDEFRPDGVRTDYSDRLGELSVPTLLVHGAEDSLVPAKWSRDAAAQIPDARLELIERCGHWPPRERPERFNEILGGFL
jgi:pimeloyl-ACP methyl ester carboxylesterase